MNARRARDWFRFVVVWPPHSGGLSARAVVVLDLPVAQGHRLHRAAPASADCAIISAGAGGSDNRHACKRLAAPSIRRIAVYEDSRSSLLNKLFNQSTAREFNDLGANERSKI